VKEMIRSYNCADQNVRLKGRQINVGEGMARIFVLSYERIVPIGRESYNLVVATYFIGDEHEHYILCSCYLIAKADGRWKVTRL
jgi:1,4-dihydroxy-2-naphthoyl-CoA synthase